MTEGDGSSSRNFRSAYYEKLGFCGNDEKNYLDLLISSSPALDVDKLNDLCERLELDRKCIDTWKILLGVDCGRKNPFDEYANVRRVRAEHFQSLRHHLEVLLKHNVIMKSRLMTKNRLSSKSREFLGRDSDISNNMPGLDQSHKHTYQQTNLIEETAEGKLRKQDCDPVNLNSLFIETTQNNGASDGQQIEQQHDCGALSNTGKEDGRENLQNLERDKQHCQLDNHQSIEPVDKTWSPKSSPRQGDENNTESNATRHDVASLLVDNLEAKPEVLILLMYLLEVGRLETSNIDEQLDSEYSRKLFAIARSFVNVSNDLQDAFFLFRNFTNNILNKT